MEANRRAKSGGKGGIFVVLAVVVFVFCTAAFGQPWDGNGVEGKIYWTDGAAPTHGSNKIRRANLNGTEPQNVVTGLGFPYRIALDISGGKMYWTEHRYSGHPKIMRANLDGSNVENLITTGLQNPLGIDIDPVGGKIYWADYDAYKIQRANLDGTNVEDLVSTSWGAWALALDTVDGKIYFSMSRGTEAWILRANLNGADVEVVLSMAGEVRGLELDIMRGKMYWTRVHAGDNKIVRANFDGTDVEILLDLVFPADLALDLVDDKIYWTEPPYSSFPPKIQRANLDGSNLEMLVTASLDIPFGIEVIPSARPAELESIEIAGSNEVAENFQAQYTAIAHYDDGSTVDVTGPAVWSVEPNAVASIDENGLLVTDDVNIPGEYITIYAEYTEDEVSVEAEKEVDVFAVCLRGSTLEFDGEDAYVSFGTGPAITGTGPFAVSAWVKTDVVKGQATLVQRSPSSAHGSYGVSILADGRVQCHTYNGGYGLLFQSNVTVNDGLWHHIAVVRTNSTDGEIYVDGSLVGTDSGPAKSLNNVPVWIGRGFTGPFYFDGEIDEVRIWNAALTQEEIQATMHIALDGGEPDLVAYWDFDEGEGQVVYDMSGNRNDGYLGSDPCGPDDSDPNWVDSDAPIGLCTQPIANAGPDQTVSAGAGCVAEVTLNGSDSNDADGDELTYAWSVGSEEIASGVNPIIELPLGEQTIELIVNDGFEDSEPDEVVITVVDDTPPEFSLFVEPNILWPPNHRMVRSEVNWEVSDNCDEEVEVSLADISMSAEGDINDYVEVGDDGSIYLRARKSKGGSGRIYTLTYEAVDDSGNAAEASTTVTVPHSRGLRKLGGGLVQRLRRQVYRRVSK